MTGQDEPADATRIAGRPDAPDPPPGGGRGTTIAPGSLLGHTYRIERLLARGGMGEVYRAQHAELGTIHAIKIILPELADNSKVVDLFRREASVLRNVRDDAVVAYDGVFRDETGRLYLVMEYVEGPALSTLMKQAPLRPDEVRTLRDRLAHGLAAAHEKGVVHRDISPDNVILPDGRIENAKIIDFGIAKLADPAASTIVGDDFAGKYSFVSPEQLGMFGGAVDARSDIYSLGLILAAAALGQPLDMGMSPISVVEARRAVPDLGQVPAELRGEIGRMLQPNPEDRPQSMRELIGIEAGPSASGRRASTELGAGDMADLRASGGRPPSGTRGRGGPGRGLVAGLVGVAVIAAAAAAYFALVGPGSLQGPATLDQPTPPAATRTETPAAETPAAEPAGTEGSPTPAAEPAAAPVSAEPAMPTQAAPADLPVSTASPPPAPEPSVPMQTAPVSTAPVQTAPVQTAPAAPAPQTAILPALDPAAIRAAVARALQPFDCATLSTRPLPDGRILVSGRVASEADGQRLEAALAGIGEGQHVVDGAEVFVWPACRDAVGLLRAYTAGESAAAPQIRPDHPEGVYREGDRLVIEVTGTPLYDQYLYVDYLDTEGQVVHLFPSPRHTDNRIAAGERVMLGADQEVYRVGPPFGPSLIFAIASRHPLFDGARAQAEPAAAYLPVLRRSLERTQAEDPEARALGGYVFTTSVPQ